MLEKKANDSLTAGRSQDDTLCVIEDVDHEQAPGCGKSPSYISSESSSHSQSQFPFLQGEGGGEQSQSNNHPSANQISTRLISAKQSKSKESHKSDQVIGEESSDEEVVSETSDEVIPTTGIILNSHPSGIPIIPGLLLNAFEDSRSNDKCRIWKNNKNKKSNSRRNSLTNNNNDLLSFPSDGDEPLESSLEFNGHIRNFSTINNPPPLPPPVKLQDGSPSDVSILSEPPWCLANDESTTQFNMDISPVAPFPSISVQDDSMNLPEENVLPENIMQDNLVQSSEYDGDGENANLLPKKSTASQNNKQDKNSLSPNPLDSHDKKSKENPNGTNTTEQDESRLYDVKYVAPDGGYGWVVLLGSLIVNILIPGLIKSYGVLFIDFIEVFEATPASAAWIPALSYWLYSSMGPFASALAIRFSHRKVTILGGLLASAGLALSCFATSISYLYVSYGIIGGLGAGLAYPIGVFMVGDYFDKKRGLANGLCTSGSALGSVLFPPLLRVLLSSYGYRIAILIVAGLILNVCIGALFYDPVEKHLKKVLVPRLTPPDNDAETNNVQSSKNNPQITNSIQIRGSEVIGGKREIAASLPIAIPNRLATGNLSPIDAIFGIAIPMENNHSDVRSGSARRATFQIGHETPQGESWSLKSADFGTSPLAARLMKEEVEGGHGSSPRMFNFFRNRHNVQNTGGLSSLDSTSDAVGDNNCNLGVTSTIAPTASGGQKSSQSRLNLRAIPEDDDNDHDCNRSEHESIMIPQNSEATSRNLDWKYFQFQELPSVNQRLLRLSTGGNTSGLSRTLSVASNASTSSFHYVSTIHHGSLLSALQADQNIPDFASTVTLKSVRNSCCTNCFECCCCCGCFKNRKTRRQSEDETDRMNKETETTPPTKPKYEYKKIIDFSLFKDGIYIIMLLSNSTTAVGYTNFIILLPAYAMQLGIDKSGASYLLSVVAGFDFIGRIGGAALSDLRFISRKWFYIVGLFLSGVSLSFLPMATTYKALFIYCACFGLASGTYIGVTAVILADELGSEKLGSSYGITLFVNGVFQLAGPPICGLLLEKIGRFQPILTALGAILVIGSLFWLAAPIIEHRRKNIAKAKNELLTTTTTTVNQVKNPDVV